VRPVIEDTAQDISRVVESQARLEDQTLTMSVEVQSVEQPNRQRRMGWNSCVTFSPLKTWNPYTSNW
jgi:hypothetical protein